MPIRDVEPIITLDLEKAILLIGRAIKERGSDYVYQKTAGAYSCQNWHEDTDTPGCIIGLAMFYLVGDKVKEHPVGAERGLLYNLGVVASEITHTYLSSIQSAQDHGQTWGQAAEWGYRNVLNLA